MLNKIKNWFYRFMYGRHGIDQLSNFTLIVAIIVSIVSMFFSGVVRTILNIVFWALIVFTYFRIFSKNIYKRQQENNWFVSKINYYKKRFNDRKQYRYFDCPKCKTHLRVPKGAGNITITCKKCGCEFDRKA